MQHIHFPCISRKQTEAFQNGNGGAKYMNSFLGVPDNAVLTKNMMPKDNAQFTLRSYRNVSDICQIKCCCIHPGKKVPCQLLEFRI